MRPARKPSSRVVAGPPASASKHREVEETEDDYDDQQLEGVMRKPPNQLQLSQAELDQYFQRTLNASDPNVNRSIVRFDYNEGSFKSLNQIDHLAVHFVMDSFLLHTDSDTAKQQAEWISAHSDYFSQQKQQQQQQQSSSATSAVRLVAEASAGPDGDEPAAADEEGGVGGVGVGTDDIVVPEHLKNQFTFSERATQTFTNARRDQELVTEPSPQATMSGQVSMYTIWDAYLADCSASIKAPKVKRSNDDDDPLAQPIQSAPSLDLAPMDWMTSDSLVSSLRLMQRLVNQISDASIYDDFKYAERRDLGSADERNDSFLSLWEFALPQRLADDRTVTALSWNPRFPDLFAVGFGSYKFHAHGQGAVACFSLKNTSHPEYLITTDSMVMCLDFHPQHPSLLAVGLYDGSVCVYDVRTASSSSGVPVAPLFVSTNPLVKHRDPVWQVRWSPDEHGKLISFYSISGDGRVTTWMINKNELIHEELLQLRLPAPKRDDEQSSTLTTASGCCFDFNPSSHDDFLIGTEEGSVQYYNKSFHCRLMRSFEGHHMAVYTVKWSPFHHGVFLSCSADWTVKLWETSQSKPVLTWDLNTSVCDVAWSPINATTFAAVSMNGIVRVYDLAASKTEPVCKIQLSYTLTDSDGRRKSKRSRLTHVSWHSTEPLLCVGEERLDSNGRTYGVITSLKLCYNLDQHERIDGITQLENLMVLETRLPHESPYIKREKKNAPAAAAATVKSPRAAAAAAAAAEAAPAE